MFQLSHFLLALPVVHVGLSLAQQFPLPVTYDTVIKSPVDSSITISYKQPDADTCATAFISQKQYSGYVNLPPFTLEPFQQDYSINTFFWFFEARDNPETAPLTIWLNGGPGQSSMVGLFAEVGPCEVIQESDGSYGTQPRLWGWDRSSNILFIDQPTQAGFSYDKRVNASIDFSNDDPAALDSRMEPSPLPADIPAWRFKNGTFSSGLTTNTEDLTAIAARSSWHFLQSFLYAFPQYNPGTRPGSDVVESAAVNLFAESYGGTYGPIFADFFEDQNERRKEGTISSDALDIRLGSVGIVNGVLDVVVAATSALKFAYNNTYGIKGIDLTTYQNGIATMKEEMGCSDLVTQCGVLAAMNDPDNLGTDEDTNNVCASALHVCQVAAGPAQAVPKSVYDYRVEPQVGPDAAYVEYLNEADVLQSIGAPVNFTSSSSAVMNAFNFNGDAARGTQLPSLAGLLERGIKVALIYGDADLIGNWYGGENVSLQLAGLVPGYDMAFPSAGYAEIVVNESYVGGAVRQYGNLSFSRIYDAGHMVPYYQPETAFTVFTRVIQGDDISMGRNVDLATFGTEGPSTSDHKNVLPPQPDSDCWIREAVTCTQEERAAVAQGKGTVEAGIWMLAGGNSTPSGRQGNYSVVPKSPPMPAATIPLTGVFSATSTPVIDETSGSGSLQHRLPFRLPRRAVTLWGEEEEEDSRKIRKGLIGGLAAAAALLFGLLTMLACCRCFKFHRNYNGPLPDDGEKGPVVVKRVLEEEPGPLHTRRPLTSLEPIPEASPRPSEEARRPPPAPAKPTPMPVQEEEEPLEPVQRAVSVPQNGRPSTNSPSTCATATAQTPPTPPPEPAATAPVQHMVTAPPTPPASPLPPRELTPAPQVPMQPRTLSPVQGQPTPPPPEPTPSPGPVPASMKQSATPPPRSPLRTPMNVPLPPSPPPEPAAAPAPSLLTRIRTMFGSVAKDESAPGQTDGAGDRLRGLRLRGAARLSPARVRKDVFSV